MLVSIHQPEFIGYLGYYAKILQADCHIVLDDVQFIKRGFIQRNNIYCNQLAKLITVPVKTKGLYLQQINDVEIDTSFDWRKKILGTLQFCYFKSPNFKRVFPLISKLINQDWYKIVDLNLAWLKFILDILSEDKPLYLASNLKVIGIKSKRLCNLVQAIDGDAYLSGVGAKAYNDESVFAECNIKLQYVKFTHPVYMQMGRKFIKNLCILDAIFNCNINEIKAWLKNDI